MTAKKAKSSMMSTDIQNLQNCIDKDYANLAKVYAKNLTGIAKAIATLNKR